MTSSSKLDRVFDQILPDGLDIRVNNAGVSGPTKPVEEVRDEEWRHTMAVCIHAQFYCVRRIVPVFKAQGHGVIINLISASGILGYPTRSPFAAAKWAGTGFTRILAMELGPDNIRVNGIVPGYVAGDCMERVITGHAALENLDRKKCDAIMPAAH